MNQDDLLSIGLAELKHSGLVSHHINSANEFYTKGIKQIIERQFEITHDIININKSLRDTDIDYVNLHVTFSNVQIGTPSSRTYNSSEPIILLPTSAYNNDKVYSGDLSMNVNIELTSYKKNEKKEVIPEVKKQTFKDKIIGKIPILVKSIPQTIGAEEEMYAPEEMLPPWPCPSAAYILG